MAKVVEVIAVMVTGAVVMALKMMVFQRGNQW